MQYELYEKGKVIMLYELTESWTGRFKVYEIGHTEGDREWLATFRRRLDAERFVRSFASVGNISDADQKK